MTERVLPGRGSPFLEKGRKSTRGCGPWTPGFIIGARKDTIILLSFPAFPAIELLYRQSLQRNYESALKPGLCGGSTCGNCTRPFLPDHLPRSGYFIFLVQQLQEAATTTHLKLLYPACQGSNSPRVQGRSVRGTLRSNPGEATLAGQRPWCFPSAFQKADSRPEGHEPRIGYALFPTKGIS